MQSIGGIIGGIFNRERGGDISIGEFNCERFEEGDRDSIAGREEGKVKGYLEYWIYSVHSNCINRFQQSTVSTMSQLASNAARNRASSPSRLERL